MISPNRAQTIKIGALFGVKCKLYQIGALFGALFGGQFGAIKKVSVDKKNHLSMIGNYAVLHRYQGSEKQYFFLLFLFSDLISEKLRFPFALQIGAFRSEIITFHFYPSHPQICHPK